MYELENIEGTEKKPKGSIEIKIEKGTYGHLLEKVIRDESEKERCLARGTESTEDIDLKEQKLESKIRSSVQIAEETEECTLLSLTDPIVMEAFISAM
ncbi:hypothetical protein KAR26_01365 [Candidatus Parcubacteria bacterium]|nr:hypothetical protein [Candidatus Parcubacteria bacterium]